jgi:hypothetical protein
MAANTVIYFGRLVWIQISTGYAVDSVYANANPTNVRCVGKAMQTVDNTTTNTVGNPGTGGIVPITVNQGIFLLNNDGSIVASSMGLPVYLVSDVSSSNSSLPTVGTSPVTSAGVVQPFVGYLAPPDIYPNVNPNALKVAVRVGRSPGTGPIPGVVQQGYANDSVVKTAAFTASPGFMHKINPSGATFAYTLPAITKAIDGMQIAVVNVSTGSTATVAAPTGSDNVGNCAGTSTGATAAGPTGGNTKVYTADYTQLAWLVGI